MNVFHPSPHHHRLVFNSWQSTFRQADRQPFSIHAKPPPTPRWAGLCDQENATEVVVSHLRSGYTEGGCHFSLGHSFPLLELSLWGSQLPCLEDTQAALWRGPRGTD